MKCRLKLFLLAAACCLCSCRSFSEYRAAREDPGLLIRQVDDARWAETSQDIERQQKKEDETRSKVFNEMMEKQISEQLDKDVRQ